MTFGLDFIKKLVPIKFKYKDQKGLDTNRIYLGFSAQELNKLLPKEEFALVSEDNEGFLMVDYSQLIAPIIKSIQELDDKLIELKKNIKEISDE
jgi:hypothetical protein